METRLPVVLGAVFPDSPGKVGMGLQGHQQNCTFRDLHLQNHITPVLDRQLVGYALL